MSSSLSDPFFPSVSSSSSYHSFFLRSDTSVWACGKNEKGQLGLGDRTDRSSPTLVPISNVIAVSSGLYHSLFLTEDGKLWSFGSNEDGQINLGAVNESLQPQELHMPNKIVQISCGDFHSVCVDDQGLVWSSGNNEFCQLGYDETPNIGVPCQVSALSHVSIVLACCGANHTLCLDSQGNLWSFGWNEAGQLGIGNQIDQVLPACVSGFNHSIIQISCGYQHSVCLDEQGSVWSFGRNDVGQLGHGDCEKRTTPMKISELKDIQQISCGGYHTVCLDAHQNVWSFGENKSGQLGHGDLMARNKPTPIQALREIVQVTCGYSQTVCLDVQGNFWSFGNNEYGQLGLGNNEMMSVPEKVKGICGKVPISKKRIKSAMSVADSVE